MTKILNKLFRILHIIMLPILLIATIYIVMFMFQRLEKEIFGANFLEFLGVIFPYLLLIILNIINMFLKQNNVKDNLFYNTTAFLVMIVITVFCLRALFDQNMFLWHKYGYNMNFNYFSDQIAPMKVMLYGLSIANVVLMIDGYIKSENKSEKRSAVRLQCRKQG